jgi:hypothetical protein
MDSDETQAGGEAAGNGQTDWQTEYKKQQAKLQSSVETAKQLASAKAQLDRELAEFKSAKDAETLSLQAQMNQFQEQMKTLAAERETLKNATAQREKELMRMRLINKEFPMLLGLDESTLPFGDSEDDLRGKLTQHSKAIEGVVNKLAEQQVEKMVQQRMLGVTAAGNMSAGSNTNPFAGLTDIHQWRKRIDQSKNEEERQQVIRAMNAWAAADTGP